MRIIESTEVMNDDFEKTIPNELKSELEKRYKIATKDYRNCEYSKHKVSVGKFCEILLRIFENILRGEYTPINDKNPSSEKILNGTKISFEKFDSELRVISHVVRVLLAFRNQREGAHCGGPNLKQIDVNLTFYTMRWVYAELIRKYNSLECEDIEEKLTKLAKIEYPDIIRIKGKPVITNPNLTSKVEILLSLFDDVDSGKTFDNLRRMNKEKNVSRFRSTLKKLEDKKLIYFDKESSLYSLLPGGSKELSNKNI